ncbi:hypothetical protein GC194_12755 [bacterium]|nr:hypothetical protein [bacterium]
MKLNLLLAIGLLVCACKGGKNSPEIRANNAADSSLQLNKHTEKDSNQTIGSHKAGEARSDMSDENIDTKELVTEQEHPVYYLDDLFAIESEQDLKRLYGIDNVKRRVVIDDESMVSYPVSLLFPESNKEVVFKWYTTDTNATELKQLESVSTESQAWSTYDGIKVGISLQQLEQLNDSSFYFYGFGWDFGGIAWFENGNLAPISTRMSIVLDYSDNSSQTDYEALLGEKKFSSHNPHAQLLNPRVVKIRMVRG